MICLLDCSDYIVESKQDNASLNKYRQDIDDLNIRGYRGFKSSNE